MSVRAHASLFGRIEGGKCDTECHRVFCEGKLHINDVDSDDHDEEHYDDEEHDDDDDDDDGGCAHDNVFSANKTKDK